MRSVSFVEHIEFEFSGNLFNEALLLEDVDNDGRNELVLGNVNGDLYVFKGCANKPWKVSRQDGMITCVGVGDLWHKGKKLLVCITADGWCHVFDVESEPKDSAVLHPTYSQLLPSNAKTVLIADVDGDGKCELVTGHTDREVHVHRWVPDQNTTPTEAPVIDHPNNAAPQEASKTAPLSVSQETKLQSNSPVDSKPQSLSGKLRKSSAIEFPKKSSVDPKQLLKPKDDKSDEVLSDETPARARGFEKGSFVRIKTWSLSSQITSLVLYKSYGTQYLLVSQPGGAFINLLASDTPVDKDRQEKPSKSSRGYSPTLEFPLPFLSTSHNPTIPTTMVALSPNKYQNQSDQSSRSNQSGVGHEDSELLAIGLLDGVLSLLNQSQVLWTLHMDQNLFSLSKLDVTKDGYEEVITCAWDGTTYIIDSEKNIVKFQFRENVMAFGAGYFAVNSSSVNVPCLVYVTFNNTVVIYWNITLSRMNTANLQTVLSARKDMRTALEKLGIVEDEEIDDEKFRKLCSKCLYGTEA